MKFILFATLSIIAVGNTLMNHENSKENRVYELRAMRQRILNDQLDLLQKEARVLEEAYGPISDWVNGSKHLPDFLRTAINQHRAEALEKMMYLGQRICIAKSLRERATTASGASTKHLRKVYLVDHQDELYESAKQAVACHFEPIVCVLEKLTRAKTNEEIDEACREFLEAETSLVSGIPLVH